jgi:DNA processing protein
MRPVGAIPGAINLPYSAGCHRLIRSGAATLISSPQDVLELIDLKLCVKEPDQPLIPPKEKHVLNVVRSKKILNTDEIAILAGLSIMDASITLSRLEQRGFITRAGSGWLTTKKR